MAPTPGINELEQLSDFRTSPTSLPEGISLLAGLTRETAFLNSRVFPLLEQAERGRDWYVAYRHDAPDDSHSLQVFVWPSGSSTEIHDHSSWGPSAASWAPCSKSTTTASTTASGPIGGA